MEINCPKFLYSVTWNFAVYMAVHLCVIIAYYFYVATSGVAPPFCIFYWDLFRRCRKLDGNIVEFCIISRCSFHVMTPSFMQTVVSNVSSKFKKLGQDCHIIEILFLSNILEVCISFKFLNITGREKNVTSI